MKSIAARIGVGDGKTFGFVAKRRKPAATIGSTSMLPPVAHSEMASSNHGRAAVCCG